jgi:subtilisin family serine protease
MTAQTTRPHGTPARPLAALVALTGLITVASTARAGQIEWRSAPSHGAAPAIGQPAQPLSETLAQLAARPDATRVVLHLSEPVDGARRTALKRAGITLLSYLGDNVFFATLGADRLDAPAVAGLGFVAAVEPIDPIVKLHPLLAAGQTPPWAVVDHTDDGTPIIGTYVMFHRDVDLEQEALPLMLLYGANVRDVLESVNAFVVELPMSVIHDLAAEDPVQWIEQALPRFSPVNNSNRALVQADEAQAPPYGLDGSDVMVLVYDAGTARASHDDFGGRLSVRDSSGMIDHATHVSATIAGNGAASDGVYCGMAPRAKIQSYGFEWDGSGVFLYNNPGDIETDYADAINTYDAQIANNSIGTNTALYWNCDITGDYGITSALIDSIVRGSVSNGEPFRIVWANGNERQTDRCGDTYYTTAPPAGAKNHIAVGAVNSNDDTTTWFTSWGPVDDGRMKPDIVAPGSQSDDDYGVTSASAASDTSYTTMEGTSMACPTATGVLALVLQDYRVQFPGAPDPRNSTLKILLAHNACDRGNPGPDNQFGYGSIRATDTIDFLRLGYFLEDEVTQGLIVEYDTEVTPGQSELKITLAWDDPPGTPNVNPALVNDIDLRVYDPSENRFFPWTLDPDDPGAPAVRTLENHVDNIEQVLVESPAAGTWRVEVVGSDVPEAPQVFSVCASNALNKSGVSISLPAGVPDTLEPGIAATFDVHVVAYDESIIPGSETLHFRYNGGEWLSVPLIALGDDLYEATLPPPVCGATPEFYVSVEGTVSGLVTNPSDAPESVHTARVGVESLPVDDNFETDQGWTITNVDLEDGAWDRGVPAGGGDRGDPPTDYDGSGQCWLTDNVDDNSDVDGGPTILTSPVYDLADLENLTCSYAAWFYNDDLDIDTLTVEVSSDDGGSWVTVEALGHLGSWSLREFNVTDYVPATTQFRIRFSAVDNPNDSITEAAVDRLRIAALTCSVTLDDCNENGILDSDDIASGRSEDNNGNGIPDECEAVGCLGDINYDGVIDLCDLNQLLAHYGMTSGATFADGDLDDDGDVDLEDLSVLLSVYGQSC